VSVSHESLGEKRCERPSSAPEGSLAQPSAGQSAPLLQLQSLAGNRAVTAYLHSPGTLQRNNGTTEEKREWYGKSRNPKHKDLYSFSARNAAQLLRKGTVTDPAVMAKLLRVVVLPTWNKYATLGKTEAKAQCEVAADGISLRLGNLGLKSEWLNVVWWGDESSGSDSGRELDDASDEGDIAPNHYAIVCQNMVIDPTGQQFDRWQASIEPRDKWLREFKQRVIPPKAPAKYKQTRGIARLAGHYGHLSYSEAAGEDLP
jgi:hypothetical protein